MLSAISYLASNTNYRLTNTSNMYNFFISVMELMESNQIPKFIENIKIHIGMTFYNDFKIYYIKKLPNSEMVRYLV